MRLATARLEHGHWRLVGMQDRLCQQFLTQCIDQRLQLHAEELGFVHPGDGSVRDFVVPAPF